ncbi:MAG: S49 family peptidase [Candidatus Limnocylindrales bacterium]
MPSWDELLEQFSKRAVADRTPWLLAQQGEALRTISQLREGRNVILYGSAFLQKPQAPSQYLTINHEDLNGFMASVHQMDCKLGLTLLLHTPGGVTNAAESVVAYLRSKFTHIEVIVPALAMSAGTMISLSAERIVMGRQSQLGPIDPQIPAGGRMVSAQAVVEQFEQARREIIGDPVTGQKGNLDAAHLWAPVLQSVGPSLLLEAQNALAYGESMVARWLTTCMFAADPPGAGAGKKAAKHFNDATTHKSHGRRIDRDEARSEGLTVEDLEDSDELQEAVLTAYHLMTIIFEQSAAAKLLWTSHGRTWIKNWAPAAAVQASQVPTP